jgi:hypothetical protein
VAHEDLRKQIEPSVKEVLTTGHNYDRKVLWTCPVEHRLQRYDVVVLAMHDERVRGDSLGGKTVHRRPDQHDGVRLDAFRHTRLNEASKRKAGERKGTLTEARAQVCRDREQVIRFSDPVIMRAGSCTHPTEVWTGSDVAEVVKGLCDRCDDFVVLGPALQRIWMSDKGNAAPRLTGIVQIDFDFAGRPVDQRALEARRWYRPDAVQILSLSTIRPF